MHSLVLLSAADGLVVAPFRFLARPDTVECGKTRRCQAGSGGPGSGPRWVPTSLLSATASHGSDRAAAGGAVSRRGSTPCARPRPQETMRVPCRRSPPCRVACMWDWRGSEWLSVSGFMGRLLLGVLA